MKIFGIFKILLILFFIFGFYSKTEAQSQSKIIINEVEYDSVQSGTDTSYEWLEIYNNSNSEINLEDWQICDNSGCDLLNFQHLPGKKFLVILTNQSAFEENYQDLPDFIFEISDHKIGSNGLSNTGDALILKNPSNEIIDQISWGNNTPIINPVIGDVPANLGYSLERCPKGKDTDQASDFILQENPSPGLGLPEKVILNPTTDISETNLTLSWSENQESDFQSYLIFLSETETELGDEIYEISDQSQIQFSVTNLEKGKTYYFTVGTLNLDDLISPSNQISATTKIYYSKAIIISEILPRPFSGSNFEFIEIYNSSSENIDLSGWILDDGPGGSSGFKIPQGVYVKPKNYLIFYKSETKISLNDSGDSARLFWPDNKLLFSSPAYKSAKKGQAWARNSQKIWLWTQKPTPGKANIFVKPQNEVVKIVNIKQARKFQKGTKVTVTGIVTVLPKTFAKTYFYLQDKTGGIQIYFSKARFPKLVLGNKIKVTGEISISQDEKRIKIRDPANIKILGKAALPAPQKIKTGQVNNFEGILVQVSGKVVELKGSTFYLNDGSGKIRVYVSKNTGFKRPKLSRGFSIIISGIVSQTKAGYRILPRFLNDFIIISKNKDQKSKISQSAKEDILGSKKAQAAASQDLGKDFRPEVKGVFQWFGWGLMVFGIIALLVLFVLPLRKKYEK